jgi:hypothetical protein
MKQKLFNVVVYGLLTFSVVNAGYLALPVELQQLIPQYNDLVAVVMGGSTSLLALGGIKVQDYMNRAKSEADSKFNLLAQNYLNLERKYDILDNSYKALKIAQDLTTQAIEHNSKLLEIDLQAKLSNPLIDAKIEELIKGVIPNE